MTDNTAKAPRQPIAPPAIKPSNKPRLGSERRTSQACFAMARARKSGALMPVAELGITGER
jgi:hypothetical protein